MKNSMKKIYCLTIILFLFKTFSIAQDYTRRWVSFYQDSSASFIHLNDAAVDANGNTYSCGYESYPGEQYYETHFCLIKVNANGVAEWKRNFSDLKDSIDEAIAVAVDTSGFVYVTGKRIDTFCNICTYNTKISDIITMKYDANGNRLWLNRYHDSTLILASPSDITISNDGALLITGNETRYDINIGTYVNNLLIEKINKNGKTVWLKKMNNVVGNAGCFDNNSNIIIGAASDPDNYYMTRKPMVLKYSSNGNLLWSNIYNEYNKNGSIYFLQCDSANNVYANGQTDTITFYNNPRIITIKYNKSGVQQWFRKEDDHTTTFPHYYGDFKADASGNCYLTGYMERSDVNYDWLTVQYNKSGVKKWSATFDDAYHSSDIPIGLAIDKKGITHVTGYVYGLGGNYSIATVHYSKTGALLDSDIYKKGNKSNGFAIGVGVDKNDNVYTAGTIGISGSSPNSIVIKYVETQNAIAQNVTQSTFGNDLKIFPNPVVNNMNIQFTNSTAGANYILAIRDVNGNLFLSRQLNNSNKIVSVNVDVHALKQGVYTATISNGINTVSKTFLKQ